MSQVTKPLVLNETVEAMNGILADIAYSSGTEPASFHEVQKIVRAGLGAKKFPVGSQFVCGKTTAMTATVGNSQGEAGITAASVNKDTFIHAIGHSGNADYEFTWDGAAWKFKEEPVELSTYGITVTGTPALGDEVVIHETAANLVWDVLGHDIETPVDSDIQHTMTLGLHDCYTELQFDAREALFYFADGLAAGTYHFLVTAHSWVSTDVNKSFQFTLTQAIPAGGQLVLTGSYNVTLENSTAKTYASATATTEIEAVTLTVGTDGTDLGSVNNSKTTTTNCLQRALLGNNNYAESALRQYINSNKVKATYWTAQNVFDRPPSWNDTADGFLYEIDEDFLAVTQKVKKTLALNTVCDGGGSVQITDRFFLLSRTEVYAGNENSIAEGSIYPWYSKYSDLTTPGTGADTNRIKYRNGAAKYWWLRSPSSSHGYYVRYIYPSGTVSNFSSYYAIGVAPACCIG